MCCAVARLLLVLLLAACGGRDNTGRTAPAGGGESQDPPRPADEGSPGEVEAAPDAGEGEGEVETPPPPDGEGEGEVDPPDPPDPPDPADPPDPPDPPQRPALRMATWNLRNFSEFGPADFRTDDIAQTLLGLEADVIGLQEIKPQEGTGGAGRQAWHALLDELPDYEGARVEWDDFDTVVGIVWRPDALSMLSWDTVMEANHHAFPRAPLEARFRVGRGAAGFSLTAIVLHLKAFGDSLDRRKAACQQLRDYVAGRQDKRYVLMGDLNDSPYDRDEDNAFLGTLLEQAPTWHFVTAQLPPESITSLGYFHYVGDERVRGEFLDHFVVHGELHDLYSELVPEIRGVPPWEYDDWEDSRSDHFPVVVDFVP